MRQLLIIIEGETLVKFNKKLQQMSDDGWVWLGNHFVVVIDGRKHYSIMMGKAGDVK